jgi:hypothetical protein
MPSHVAFTSAQGVQVHVQTGNKSEFDFRVRFMGPHGRLRTPKHIHLIIELYVKHAFNGPLTLQLRDYFLQVFHQLQPAAQFPPALQVYQPAHINQFLPLNAVGEFPVDLFMVMSELISIQERTNYPNGSATVSLYQDFMVKDMFSMIQSATWLGPG